MSGPASARRPANLHGPGAGRVRRLLTRGGRRHVVVVGFAAQLTFAALAFIGSVAAARALGPAGKGELTAWSLVAVYGALVLNAGIAPGLGRAFLSGGRAPLVSACAAHAALALIATGLGSVALVLAGLDSRAVLLFVVAGIPVMVLADDALALAQAAKSPWLYHLPRLASVSVTTAGYLALALLERPDRLAAAWVAFVGGMAVMAILLLAGLIRGYGWARTHDLREIIALGRSSYGATLFDRLLIRADQSVVGSVIGRTGLGVYGTAVNVAEVGQYLGNAVGLAVFEDSSTLPASRARRLLVQSAAAVALLMLPVVVVAWLVVESLFGDGFADAGPAVALLAPGIAARAAGFAGTQMLIARGEGHRASVISGACLALGIPAWALGAWQGGVFGAAAANSAVYVLQAALVYRAFSGSLASDRLAPPPISQ